MKLSSSIKLFTLLIAPAILLSACGGKEEKKLIFTEKAQKRTIIEIVSANGKVQPVNEVKISPDVSGEITDLFIKEGQEIKKGDVLLKIQPDLYQSAVNRAEATMNGQKSSLANAKSNLKQLKSNFANTEASYNRNVKLFKSGAISQSEFDLAQAQYDAAKANIEAANDNIEGAEFAVKSGEASLKEARDNLSRTTIYAPVDGTVSKLNNRKGERVVGTAQMAGTEIMRIADLTKMEVQVDVNENDIVRVHLGDTADITVDAFGDRKFKGIVTEIGNSANSAGVTADQVTNFPVKILILESSYADLLVGLKPNESPFRPGMTASVDVKTKTVVNVVSVPIGAVTISTGKDDAPQGEEGDEEGGGPPPNSEVKDKNDKGGDDEKMEEVVYVYDNGKAKKVVVTTGIQDNNYIEITKGLADGAEVIAGPYRVVSKQLKNGTVVEKKTKEEINKFGTDKK